MHEDHIIEKVLRPNLEVLGQLCEGRFHPLISYFDLERIESGKTLLTFGLKGNSHKIEIKFFIEPRYFSKEKIDIEGVCNRYVKEILHSIEKKLLNRGIGTLL